MGWQDRQDSQVLANEPGAEFPWIQWVNRGQDLDPRHQSGGFFITSENLALLGNDDVIIPGAEASKLVFSSGESQTGVLMQNVAVAVLASRFSWQVREGQRTVLHSTYQPGARGKLQTLVLLKTRDGFVGPVMITLTGTVTQDMTAAIKLHRQQVRQATAGKGASSWFWLRLMAGEPTRRGSANASSTVTPILRDESLQFDVETDYIGDDAADLIEELFESLQVWEADWEGTGAVEPEEPEGPPEEPAQTGSNDIRSRNPNPLGDALGEWSKAWNALKKLGVTAPFLDTTFNVHQMEQATVAMLEAAASITAGQDKDTAAAELIAKLDAIALHL